MAEENDLKELAKSLRSQVLELDKLKMHRDALLPSAGREEESGGKESTGDIAVLDRLIDNSDLGSATFPVYGAMNAGKSTFLAYVLRQKLLPEQGLPMTSIPIRIKHVPNAGGVIRLTLPQCDKWNACVADFRQKLLAGSLAKHLDSMDSSPDADQFAGLRDIIERSRENKVQFTESAEGADVRGLLYDISHFVRVLWKMDIDFEADHGIVIESEQLPLIELTMKAFESFGNKSFSLLDTPGPNEAKALEALQKLGPKVMRSTSGWYAISLFIFPSISLSHLCLFLPCLFPMVAYFASLMIRWKRARLYRCTIISTNT